VIAMSNRPYIPIGIKPHLFVVKNVLFPNKRLEYRCASITSRRGNIILGIGASFEEAYNNWKGQISTKDLVLIYPKELLSKLKRGS
jgi:hypothetical protein